jgi:hypothetical protein
MSTTTHETHPLNHRPGAIRLSVRVLPIALVAVVLAAGVWGTIGKRAPHPHAAALGEQVALAGGGTLRVDRVGNVDVGHMDMPMSGPGMQLPAPNGAKMPHVPKGQRRIGVDLTLASPREADAVHFRASDMQVAPAGSPNPVNAAAADVLREVVPSGASFSTNLAFNVPKATRRLEVRYRDAERPIALTLGRAPASRHH